MRKFKRLTRTLALLRTAVGGAWAQSSLNVTFKANNKTTTVENVTLPKTFQCSYNNADGDLDLILKELYGWTGDSSETICANWSTPKSSDANKVVAGKNGNDHYITIDNVFEGTVTITGDYIVDLELTQYSLEISIAEPTEWSLTPDETGKTWTLDKMPASNIELQVEYFAESNLFLSKDALADKANIAVTAGETTVEFGEDGKSANTITEGTAMTVKYNGTKKILGVNVAKVDLSKAYLKWDADQKKLVATDIPAEVTTVKDVDGNAIWQAGTYVVEGEVTIGGKITLAGNVDLIIKDGAKLTVNNYIYGGTSKYNLSIYGQANQTGQLVVNCSDDNAIMSITTLEVHSCKVKATSSSDYCCGFLSIVTFNVYGGSVDAENTGTYGSGISLANDGSMNIYGGDVKAVGNGAFCYGIAVNVSPVTVYGGKLWAENAGETAFNDGVTLTKGAGFSGKIETSGDGTSWTEHTSASTPTTKYVRVGY